MADRFDPKDIVKRVCCAPLTTPDRKRFILRLLLTLYGKDAMTWTWTTVRNTVWSAAFRRWLSQLILDEAIPEPSSERFRVVRGHVMSQSDPNGTLASADLELFMALCSMNVYVVKNRGLYDADKGTGLR